MRNIPDDAVMNTEEAAELFGIQPATIRKWIRERRIPARRIGKRYWIVGSALKAMLTGETAPADSPGESDERAREVARRLERRD